MEKNQVVSALAALGQPTRLDVFRLLIVAGRQGMAAGEIADKRNVRQNTLSANLSILANAGLLRNNREGRSIRYFVDTEGLRGLLTFLMQDCCGGEPELCTPFIDRIARAPETTDHV
jgi:ArsR family transcriptional regulator, arsenate/arsenite/antimonite-responsive transcriptional repressor